MWSVVVVVVVVVVQLVLVATHSHNVYPPTHTHTHTTHRAAIILRAAALMSTKYRPEILATTMLGQAKTIIQAEVDATCETIDFLRFAVSYAAEIYKVCPYTLSIVVVGYSGENCLRIHHVK